MDRRERYLDLDELLRLVFKQAQARLWTALPGIVQSFNAEAMTVAVQPAINGSYLDTLGESHSLQMPQLLDCPVVFPGGGGATLTFPVAAGDECLVVFASRCIDGWWQLGTVIDPPEVRMHNLSDGFALVGVRSQPRAYAPPTGTVQLQSDDGNALIQLNPTTHALTLKGASLTVTTTGAVSINGATISSAGEFTDAAGVVVGSHVHSGVQTGSGDSGPPVP